MANTKEAVVAPVATPQERPQRKERVPVSGPRDILTVRDKDPNYVYRWVKDIPGRVQRFQDAGYEVVMDTPIVGQSSVDRSTGLGTARTRLDGANTLVLMRQRKEWYNEDQQAKQLELDSMEAVLYSDGLKKAERGEQWQPREDEGYTTVKR